MPDCDAAACRVTTIGEALTDLGHDVTFLSWGGKYNSSNLTKDGDYSFMGMRYIITNEIDGNGLKDKLIKKLTIGSKSLKYIKDLKSKPDIIIAYNTPYLFNKRLIKFCVKHNIKLVSDITEWYDSNELNRIDNYFNNLNMTKLQFQIKNKIVISSFLDNYYSNSFNIVIPPLSFLTKPKFNREGILNENFKLSFIYAGNPAKKDLVHTFINVVNRLNKSGIPIIFRILGITRDDYCRNYANLLEDIDLSENIIFYGKVAHELIPQYYSESDFMVLLREINRKSTAGFPTKFAESMCLGIPVITNPTSDLGLYLKNGVNGFMLDEVDSENLYKSLINIYNSISRDKITEMKMAAEETGRNNFTPKSINNKLADFISNLK